jgi:hypothetical protein
MTEYTIPGNKDLWEFSQNRKPNDGWGGCSLCAFWDRDDNDVCVGKCRKNPPVLSESVMQLLVTDVDLRHVDLSGYDLNAVTFWPVTVDDDWCGEWTPHPYIQGDALDLARRWFDPLHKEKPEDQP